MKDASSAAGSLTGDEAFFFEFDQGELDGLAADAEHLYELGATGDGFGPGPIEELIAEMIGDLFSHRWKMRRRHGGINLIKRDQDVDGEKYPVFAKRASL